MSRVFLAEETSLGRKVVVKVLPSDLAATVNVERFRREIQLAAQLQHPHIVPLLAAGISDGLPYYTMPFVAGESLRARLARAGELPINDTVKILRDVLSALSYAHEQGVVHRDIKPDNVLLSKHSAVVTDFGVAKALNAAADTHTALTSVGVALGTPAYMAPEQAAADPGTDHRADIYAVGAMAYEMLTGLKVFGDRPVQRMLAAHAVEIPDRVEKHRPSVPPALATLVMAALEKHPADRPQSADEMLAMLESVGTPSPVSGARNVSDAMPAMPEALRSSPRRSLLIGFAIAAVVIAVGLTIAMGKRVDSAKKMDENLVVVVPFRVTGAEQSLSYLREGMLDLLAAKLTGEGGPRAADPRSVLSAWRRATQSPGEDLAQDETVRLAANLGAGQVILGGIVGTPARMVVNATVLEVPSGKPIREVVTVEGPADSLASLVDQLAVKLLSLQAGENQQHLAELASASLPAIRAYLEGKAAYRQGRYTASMNHFLRAVTVDSTFALAGLGLFRAANWIGTPLIQKGIAIAWGNKDKLSGPDRMLAIGAAGRDYPTRPDLRHLISALDSATKLGPGQADLWFEHGDVMFHWGRTIGIQDALARSRNSFARAYELDSSFAPAVEHLIEVAIASRDTAQIRRLTARYLALDSAAEHRDYIRWRAAHALGDRETLAEFRQKISSMDADTRARIVSVALADGIEIDYAAAIVNDYLKKVEQRLELSFLSEAIRTLISFGQLRRAEELLRSELRTTSDTLGRYPLWLAAKLYFEADQAGEADVAAAIRRAMEKAGTGIEEEAQQHGVACVLGIWSVRRGDIAGASEMIAVMRRTLTSAQAVGAVAKESLCLAFVDGVIETGRNPARAPAVLSRLDELSLRGAIDFFWPALNLELSRMYEQRGDRSKALEVLRRRPYRSRDAREFLTTYLREEGRLAAAVGDREGAARALRRFLTIREGADPVLRPQLDSVRALLASVEQRR